ncbi:hypothetical protein HDU79_009696 [Rhizoclosmatium sp. JEL0117]|nr:hypothetical protein HDU79_009696 [Rhizoclosmatium sp. JEL0117]
MTLKSPLTGLVVTNVVTRNYVIGSIVGPWKEVKKLIADQKAALEAVEEHRLQAQAKESFLKVLVKDKDETIRMLTAQLKEVTQQLQQRRCELEAIKCDLSGGMKARTQVVKGWKLEANSETAQCLARFGLFQTHRTSEATSKRTWFRSFRISLTKPSSSSAVFSSTCSYPDYNASDYDTRIDESSIVESAVTNNLQDLAQTETEDPDAIYITPKLKRKLVERFQHDSIPCLPSLSENELAANELNLDKDEGIAPENSFREVLFQRIRFVLKQIGKFVLRKSRRLQWAAALKILVRYAFFYHNDEEDDEDGEESK